jgi:hypothetical protein
LGSPAIWLGVFAATVAVDYAWSAYMMAAAERKPHKAAFWSVAIVLLGAFSFLSYVENRWLLIPAAAGGYFGTWLAVWREKRKATP